ncbi:MAG: glutamate racemase [Prosthecobacter sp.]
MNQPFPYHPAHRHQRILGVDSGCGGVSVIERCHRLLRHEHFTLVADNAGHPYGDDKSLEQVAHCVVEAVAPHLESRMFKVVQIACNTASHPEIVARLKNSFGVPVLGLIEPTAREVLCRHGYGRKTAVRIGIMGTPTLLKYQGYHQEFLAQAAAMGLPQPEMIDIPCHGLAAAIEKDVQGKGERVRLLLGQYLRNLPSIEVLIIGCTHFCLRPLRDMIASTVGPGTAVFDPAEAAAKNLLNWLGESKMKNDKPPCKEPLWRTSRADTGLIKRMRQSWWNLREAA